MEKNREKKEKISIIGSGNFGSAIAKLIGENVEDRDEFDSTLKMWVYEELIDGKKLTDIINKKHENVKYLPGIKIPATVIATSSLEEAMKDSSILVFVLPHDFIITICKEISKIMGPKQKNNLKIITLVKGVSFDKGKLTLMSEVIKETLGVKETQLAAMSGPNIANELANKDFCETAIGSKSEKMRKVMFDLFDNEYFKVSTTKDIEGVQLCGALKNVVALGAGLCDGMDMRNNTKATIMKIGLDEMISFSKQFFEVDEKTFYGIAGIADLITTCYGGRNRRFAEEFAKKKGIASISKIEKDLFNGQKIQGVGTLEDMNKMMKKAKLEKEFPLFKNLHDIFFNKKRPEHLFKDLI